MFAVSFKLHFKKNKEQSQFKDMQTFASINKGEDKGKPKEKAACIKKHKVEERPSISKSSLTESTKVHN